MGKDKIVASCDIGSSKICTLIGKIDENDNFSIIGLGEDESKGIKKGVVVNIETTTKNIKKATYDAELMSGHEVDSIITNIGGEHLSGINSRGVVAVSGRNNEISHDDIARVIDAARTIVVPKGREIIHVLEQEYIVDNQDGIKDPLGMSGVRLEATVHLVTASSALIKNLKNSILRASYNFADLAISSLAASEAVLSDDEKELGVLLVDIGAQTTDIICFYNNSVYFTYVIPMGSFNITKDIAILLKIPIKEAEKLKINSGYAFPDDISDDEKIEIPQIGANPSRLESKKYLSEIIEARLKELFEIINNLIRKNNLSDFIASGIVLTGGGAKQKGIEQFCNKHLDFPVRVGKPFGFKSVDDRIFSPEYSVAVGLLKLFLDSDENENVYENKSNFLNFIKKIFRL